MSFLDQLPALIGVIVGAAGSYAASSRTDKVRWQRSRAERWDEKRFEIYSTYASVLNRKARIALRIGVARGFEHDGAPLAPDEGLEQLAEAETERGIAWQAVLLVGDSATIRAAREWRRAVFALEQYARGLQDDPEGWKSTYKRIGVARDEFYAAARPDLGITGRVPPNR
jgi:hypothetical protein